MLQCIMSKEITQEKDLLRELQDENIECDNVVINGDPILFDTYNKIKEAVLRKAYNMRLLIKYYPDLYPYKENSIYSAIIEDYRRRSVSRTTLDTVRDAFKDPEYDCYKSHVYNTAKRRSLLQQNTEISEQELQEQSTGEKYSADVRIGYTLEFLENNRDHPKFQTWIEQQVKEHLKQQSKVKKTLEDEDKITIPRPELGETEQAEERPDWVPANVTGRMSLTAAEAYKMSEAWKDIAIRIYQFPPLNEKDDEFYSGGIETMHALIVPGTDLKYVRDTLSYLDITLEKETQSVHSAMSKSKILTPSGKYRKVTREQIADIAPQMILLSIHIVEKIPGFIAFCLYLLREQKPFSGEFHLNRHDKLSESAFGKSSYLD
jgi:hypothetical protein